MSDFIQRVARGAALLGKLKPDWGARVPESENLIMWHPEKDVLAHIFGAHFAGLCYLGLDRAQAAAHGFALRPGDSWRGYSALARLWADAAASRIPQSGGPAPRPMGPRGRGTGKGAA